LNLEKDKLFGETFVFLYNPGIDLYIKLTYMVLIRMINWKNYLSRLSYFLARYTILVIS